MDANWISERILLGTGALWLILEIVLLILRAERGGVIKLISGVIRYRAARWSFIPWVWGTLGGHFFGPTLPRNRALFVTIMLLTVAVLASDFLLRAYRPEWVEPETQPAWLRPIRNRWYVFLAALVAGSVLWSQS